MSQITSIDFTLSADVMTHTELQQHLQEWCKKWVYQLEESDTGYKHYQGRVSLIKKRRLNELVNKFIPRGHLSATTTGVHNSNNFNYVMKADTRIEGPFSDKEYTTPPTMTRQLRQFLTYEPYPWQTKVMEMAKQTEDRYITVIYDTVGNAGKSILAEFMEYHRVAFEIPALRSMEDIMQCVMSVPTHPAYLIDMPRGMKKDKLGEFYSGIECIKNGVAYDKRYSFKKKRFDRPQVFVFTNVLPDFDLLSPDRWRVFEVQDFDLVERPQ